MRLAFIILSLCITSSIQAQQKLKPGPGSNDIDYRYALQKKFNSIEQDEIYTSIVYPIFGSSEFTVGLAKDSLGHFLFTKKLSSPLYKFKRVKDPETYLDSIRVDLRKVYIGKLYAQQSMSVWDEILVQSSYLPIEKDIIRTDGLTVEFSKSVPHVGMITSNTWSPDSGTIVDQFFSQLTLTYDLVIDESEVSQKEKLLQFHNKNVELLKLLTDDKLNYSFIEITDSTIQPCAIEFSEIEADYCWKLNPRFTGLKNVFITANAEPDTVNYSMTYISDSGHSSISILPIDYYYYIGRNSGPKYYDLLPWEIFSVHGLAGREYSVYGAWVEETFYLLSNSISNEKNRTLQVTEKEMGWFEIKSLFDVRD